MVVNALMENSINIQFFFLNINVKKVLVSEHLELVQAVLVAGKKSLIQRKGVLDTTHEILERLEAHLRAAGQFTVF